MKCNHNFDQLHEINESLLVIYEDNATKLFLLLTDRERATLNDSLLVWFLPEKDKNYVPKTKAIVWASATSNGKKRQLDNGWMLCGDSELRPGWFRFSTYILKYIRIVFPEIILFLVIPKGLVCSSVTPLADFLSRLD